MHKELLRSKTAWTGIAAIVGAVGGYFTGTLPADVAIQTVVASLLAIFLRDGMIPK